MEYRLGYITSYLYLSHRMIYKDNHVHLPDVTY